MHKSSSTIKKTIAFYWRHAWRYPKYVVGLMVFVPLTILCHQFLPPLVAARILDRLSQGDFTKGDVWGSFGNDLLVYGALTLLSGVVLWRIVIVLIWKLEALVVRDIHRHVFQHLLTMSADFHANRFGGSLVSQAGKLAGSYIRLADTTVFEVSTLILSFIFTAIILVPRAPVYAAILFAFSVFFIVTSIFVTRKIRELGAVEANAQNKQTGLLADAITNVLAVKSFAASQKEHGVYNEATEHTRRTIRDVMRASVVRETYFASITSGITVIAIVMATAGIVNWGADIATMFLILTYTGAIGQRLWEFSQHVLRNYNRGFADAKEMIEILGIQPEVKDPAKPEPPRITQGEITIKNMTFSHVGNEQDALFNGLSLHIKAGEKIGLVGHSGSGKTTLTKLLLRFADIDGGEIMVDGQNIAAITQDDLRAHIAYVPQEPLLFHRTIKENIAYGKPDAAEDEIMRAARAAHAAEFIQKLPQSYGTLVGERGVKLSGGQRQRVAIARAMLKNSPILVLDEATSALDSESEQLIQDALWRLMQGRTAIVIAHRLSTVQKMDRIIVLDDGRIVEQGTHAELLARGGTYASLWAHQSGGFIEE